MKIYHITDYETWIKGIVDDNFFSKSLNDHGFIHCCKENQIQFVLNHWFQKEMSLVKVIIDNDKLEAPLVFENSEGGVELFPHIYGPINLDAVVDILTIEREG